MYLLTWSVSAREVEKVEIIITGRKIYSIKLYIREKLLGVDDGLYLTFFFFLFLKLDIDDRPMSLLKKTGSV